MRKDLVEKMLGSIQTRLFEDVWVKVGAAEPVLREKAISGIDRRSERLDEFGTALRVGTHITRGLLAALPGLAKGHVLITDEGQFRVLDTEPAGDGRLEIAISLDKTA